MLKSTNAAIVNFLTFGGLVRKPEVDYLLLNGPKELVYAQNIDILRVKCLSTYTVSAAFPYIQENDPIARFCPLRI